MIKQRIAMTDRRIDRVRAKRVKIVSKKDYRSSRQNTYKHTSFKKRDQRNTKKLTKEDKELNRKILSDDYSRKH
ncbi:hypothetical protein AGMMS50222_04650 [Endomicrobiia bacterium]|nr:hypothetical protein AGMMS49531_06420 [Endomicrobiia bacterium]GHT65432.1 hypothetical protein AGMMS49556_05270 [Endomicrobiia bacterium]GHT72147.1 hypothetical protein AGMMS49950_10430 [Endomicrobiia bacterium]GHT74814.1 hypothetical protein AGMMS50222_04650 [Endomicrobiia bacterium]